MTSSRWHKPFTLGMYPADYESCDWRYSNPRRGRPPAFWRYVKHGACHWLVNAALRLAMLTDPNRQWRVVTSDKHSTVWDGDDTLFDLQFSALGVGPEECWKLARRSGEILPPGMYRPTFRLEYWKTEMNREEREKRKAHA
jgi:hypothetical protein